MGGPGGWADSPSSAVLTVVKRPKGQGKRWPALLQGPKGGVALSSFGPAEAGILLTPLPRPFHELAGAAMPAPSTNRSHPVEPSNQGETIRWSNASAAK